jgi:uncharacterized membrane protein
MTAAPPVPAPAPSRAVTEARVKLMVSFCAAVAAATAFALTLGVRSAPLVGWDVLALVYGVWTWRTVWPMDGALARSHANREDPSRDLTDLVLLGAAIASLIAVGMVLFGVSAAPGWTVYGRAGLAVFSVSLSWLMVHTVYTLRYARLYYSGTPGGIDFNGDNAPDYRDFAYLAFTIGMTFQVSDTNIEDKTIRRTALRQALISYLFGAVLVAMTVNVGASLLK